jgi:hypothetical protein
MKHCLENRRRRLEAIQFGMFFALKSASTYRRARTRALAFVGLDSSKRDCYGFKSFGIVAECFRSWASAE